MNPNGHRVPGPIYVTSDLRAQPWDLAPGHYREGEVFKVGHFHDPDQGPVVAQWCKLTDGSDAVVYTTWGQAVEVCRTMVGLAGKPERKLAGKPERGPLTSRMAVLWTAIGVALGLGLADMLALYLGWH